MIKWLKYAASTQWILPAVMMALLLPACGTQKKPPVVMGDPEYQRSLHVTALEQQLKSQGVNVVQVGQTIRLTILSQNLFNPYSANFNSNAPSILNTVAQLMLILQSTSAQIAGYVNTEYSAQVNRALSARQAQVVEDYLWSRGVDTRLMYAVGKGTKESLTFPSGGQRGDINNRIEIQFQYLPLLSTLVH